MTTEQACGGTSADQDTRDTLPGAESARKGTAALTEETMMIDAGFIYKSSLQYRIKALEQELESFKNGGKYAKMKEAYRKETEGLRREIKRLKDELVRAHKETKDAVDMWYGTCEDIIRDEEKAVRKSDL